MHMRLFWKKARIQAIRLACVCLAGAMLLPALADDVTGATAPAPAANPIAGTVTEVINAAGYTYIGIDNEGQQVWAAGPVTALAVGDKVTIDTGMPMTNFHSKAMQRDFPLIYFVGRFITDKTGDPKPVVDPHAAAAAERERQPVTDIAKAEGGHTIAEVYARKNELAGNIIRVRGKVTKYTGEVLSRNWLHIRDSSTLDDLIVTTSGTTAMDEVVTIEGKLALDKDFGFGYTYPVMIEDASLVEP